MTKVLIVSDSHGLTDQLNEIKLHHQVNYLIHCGDSELAYDAEELEGFIKVGGNCDFDNRFSNEKVVKIDRFTFFITHGHLHQVKQNLTTIGNRAAECGAQIICFGHTHIAGVVRYENQIFINPGSIRLPRNRKEKTYAVLEWTSEDDKIAIHFYTTDHQLVSDLSCEINIKA